MGNWRQHWRRWLAWILGVAIAIWAMDTGLALRRGASAPIDAFLVLGGSIRREVYAAQFAKLYPEAPILISAGSPAPCVKAAVDLAGAPSEAIWLEGCARSTFGNFFYTLPVLERWGVRKVELVTSPSHLPRARWLAQIILGSHGIWVETYPVVEKGVPANRESWLKTTLDGTRSLAWAVASQFYAPACEKIAPLERAVEAAGDLSEVKCEYQFDLRELQELQPRRSPPE